MTRLQKRQTSAARWDDGTVTLDDEGPERGAERAIGDDERSAASPSKALLSILAFVGYPVDVSGAHKRAGRNPMREILYYIE